ncbi:zinc finger protein on ecdysone puffs-like [Daktulosphaira vitifoliae]|uniref:zinc finger protein on ecdysone puffs-like n=1 Tax=Daktulosphaira vitifoliae TaxID=58002 RepID=UPI0021AA1A5D|nr:zinc finger protein on ecdysone puffs-like [Daktulosphaira vitifoliae]
MSYNRRSGGYGGNSGNYGGGSGYGQSGNSNYGGSNNYGGGNNYNGSAAGRYSNYGNYGRNPKMSPWESGVSPGGGNMMPNVHPNQMALASDLLSKIFANDHQGGYGGSQNWGPSPGMMRRQESYKNQNRRRPDNRNRRPPPKKDDKKKDSKPEADKNDQSGENADSTKKDTTGQEHVDYDGIPTAVLFCHVCQKHMWDGASFEKHVRGRPHELMMTYLDETYKMQVELMRHQIRAAENQREIDLERMQAQNKGKAKPLFQNYCPMCNINFYGPLTGHRKSDRHRKLKQFLHPECKMCDTLFHTRLEWDDHKLSAAHLRKVGEQRRLHNPDLKDDEFELLDVIQIDDDEQTEEIPVAIKTDMIEDKDIKEEEDEESNEKNKSSENNDVEIDVEKSKEIESNNDEQNENVKKDDTDLKKEKDEKYNPANIVGRELVVKTGGFVCRICSVFMKDSDEANLHCQTATHYINYTTITKLHAKINNRKRKVKDEKKEIENGDINDEVDNEPAEKQARLEENGNSTFSDQNGTKEIDDDVQEIKVEVPIVEIMDDDKKNEIEEPATTAEPETAIESETDPVNEAEPVPPPSKTTPTRGRGGARGRGVARRGRSSR